MVMALDFYHGDGSPYSWRVWLALEHKAIAYELKRLSFSAGDTKKAEFIAINPRHQVPTIVDDGFALWESMAILEYLDEHFVSGRKLYPGGSRERARIRRLCLEAASYVGEEGIDVVMGELIFKHDGEPDMERVAQGRARLVQELEYFARELQGDFLAGGAPTAADFVLYPYIGYVKRVTFRKPETKLTEVLPAKIAAWAKRIEALPYFDKTFPPHWK
jgi:glutathione S-transferase